MKSNNIQSQDELLRLVNRYFEGETSIEEERNLRRLLVESTSHDEAIEEARAVMGIFACSRVAARRPEAQSPMADSRRRRRRRSQWAAISAVASVAVLIAAVVSLTRFDKMPNSDTLTAASYCRLSDHYDSIAQIGQDNHRTISAGHLSVATSANGVNSPDTPEEISALINSEMGCMAEAERSMYESIADDFVSLQVIMK